jgi:hypothetical protein
MKITDGAEKGSGVEGDLKIEVVAVDPQQIRKFTSEDQFTELSVRLLVEAASYVCVAACMLGNSSPWNRDHAAVGVTWCGCISSCTAFSTSYAGIPLDEVDNKGVRDWGGKNIFEKAKAVGLDHVYLAAIGGGSNSIHGNWQEIAGHHLMG